jgi:NADPH-dependent curcumin reductase CurA
MTSRFARGPRATATPAERNQLAGRRSSLLAQETSRRPALTTTQPHQGELLVSNRYLLYNAYMTTRPFR